MKAIRVGLETWAGDRGWSLRGDEAERLARLGELWERYARSMNLTAARSEEALVEHVVDGLETARCAREALPHVTEGRWVDVGSGAGFPGLVVAALLDWEVVLVESRQK